MIFIVRKIFIKILFQDHHLKTSLDLRTDSRPQPKVWLTTMGPWPSPDPGPISQPWLWTQLSSWDLISNPDLERGTQHPTLKLNLDQTLDPIWNPTPHDKTWNSVSIHPEFNSIFNIPTRAPIPNQQGP